MNRTREEKKGEGGGFFSGWFTPIWPRHQDPIASFTDVVQQRIQRAGRAGRRREVCSLHRDARAEVRVEESGKGIQQRLVPGEAVRVGEMLKGRVSSSEPSMLVISLYRWSMHNRRCIYA